MHSTIVAIATPPGIGGVGVVRLSGPEASSIVYQLTTLVLKRPRYAYRVLFRDPYTDRPIDDGLAIFFAGPHSYTGEDVVECHLHGNPFLLKTIVSLCVALGAQMAGPGEFTARAFLNGKLDLTQAEAVADLIHTHSEQGQQVALSHLKGTLFQHLTHYRKDLMQLLEHIEGSLDFPDEIEAPDIEILASAFSSLAKTLHAIIKMGDYGRMAREGVRCAIIGRPNAGKSSLLNQLLGEKRALVSPIPGTTRDFIEADVQLGGLSFRFFDTAGLRDDSVDPIELMGIKQVRRLIREADAILWVIDSSQPHTPKETVLQRLFPRKKPLYVILNKSDKRQQFKMPMPVSDTHIFSLSSKTGKGLLALKTRLSEDFTQHFSSEQLPFLCNARQQACLLQCHHSLKTIQTTLQTGFALDTIAYALKNAISHLGEATGDDLTEEVLDGVFSRFCVGK